MKKIFLLALTFIGFNLATFAQAAPVPKKQPAKVVKMSATPGTSATVSTKTPEKPAPSSTPAKASALKASSSPTTNAGPLKKDGTPDKRYKQNQHLKKDGTPDKRFKENKK